MPNVPLLDGVRAVCLVVNLPGPATAARLRDLGASVTKVEPPEGDQMAAASPAWYAELASDMTVLRLDLQDPEHRGEFEDLLEEADLLITSSRPAGLARLGLGWEALHARFPRLCHVAIVGYPPPDENRPGHDLNYQAVSGMLRPPGMPLVLVADLAGAERAATEAVALLLARERGRGAGHRMVSLAEAGASFTASIRHGVTTPDGVLGGALPAYGLYAAREGYVAVGVIELHFLARLAEELGSAPKGRKGFEEVFKTRTAQEWEVWAKERGLPISACVSWPVKHPHNVSSS